MTTQKQPEPLPEFEPFDTERARAGEDVWHIDGTKAKECKVFSNGIVSILWYMDNDKGESEYISAYNGNRYPDLRHKRKAKPIEFEYLLLHAKVFNNPSEFDTVELIYSVDGSDFMKATKGKMTVYYLGKFNDGTLK